MSSPPRPPITDLALAAGLDVRYTGWNGAAVDAKPEALRSLLAAIGPALGFTLDHVDQAPAALAALARARWAERVAPVLVAWDGATLAVPFRVRADIDAAWSLELTTETGVRHTASGRLFTLPARDHAYPDGQVHCVRDATLPLAGETGYHKLAWKIGDAHGESLVLAAPTRAFGAPGSAEAGGKRWGVFAPLYALRTAASGGTGDLATLSALFAHVARRGGRYVATLPLLAGFLDEPFQPSPYAPCSRLAWNELYLDLAAAGAKLAPATAATAAALRTAPLVDYRAQYAWRRAELDKLAAAAFAVPATAAAITVWAEGQGVVDYAVFRALGEARRTSWPSWEAPWRDGSVRITRLADVPVGDGGVDLARVHTHLYAQWAMDHQLAELGAGKVQLYLDLPVGVNADAYEVWRDRELFLLGASTGAPPDSLFLGGQSWGLPPLHPEVVRRRGYQYVIDCVRHHMRHAGMLRVDHVMGLFRLFAVPAGFGATEGVYLRYQADELMAILTLESNRHRCALVGEDLGTVPDQVRPAMARHGLARLHVGQFSMPGAVGQPTIAAVPEAIASLNTHDTPTFGGWWRGTDIDDRRALGLITDAQVVTERAERAASKAALVAFVDRGKLAPTSLPDEARAALGATVDLARGPAEVVLVNLEDLWLEPSPQNVPGTSDERPNWRRPFAQDPLAAGADLSVLDAVAAVRPTR